MKKFFADKVFPLFSYPYYLPTDFLGVYGLLFRHVYGFFSLSLGNPAVKYFRSWSDYFITRQNIFLKKTKNLKKKVKI